LAAASEAAAVLLGVNFDLESDDLRRLPHCRGVVRYGVGVDNVDVEAALALGMTVSNVPDYGIEEVANHTLSLLLFFARRLDLWGEALRAGQWGAALPRVRLRRLSLTTLGIIGAGRIGRAVLMRAKGFWPKILVHDPWVNTVEIERLGGMSASLDDVLRASDFLTLHVPSTPETRGMLDRARLSLLKDGAVLVNCSRGDVIDEEALAELLASGKLGGAGLDVFAAEPPALDGIVSQRSVWATPHVAYVSVEAVQDLRRKAAEEAGRIVSGEPPLYAVTARG
jgi:phosphoglycerate dehydrogenase-like enzyme